MPSSLAARRVVHISDSPDESRLLAAELSGGDTSFEVLRAATGDELLRRLEASPIDLIIADLPLPWEQAHEQLAEIQRTRPEIEVIFRWGEPGARTAEAENEQIARLVEQRLDLRPTRRQDERERRDLMRELARRQEVLLRIQRQPLWNFEHALREATRATAQALSVERVSVWKFSPDHARLDCLMLHKRSTGEFENGAKLEAHPRYFRALESSLSIAAHDSLRDPRTSEFRDDYLAPLGIPSMLDSPIRLEGRVEGVLCLEHVGEPRHWSVLDQCAAVAMACHVARIFEVRKRREAEERLQALERLDALGRVVGQVAHDFNNRLTVLAGWVGLLRRGLPTDASAQHCVDELDAELSRAAEQVRELLALGRGSAPARSDTVELRGALGRIAPTMRRLLGESIDFTLQIPDGEFVVRLDEREVESILLNLGSNARDAMGGSGSVRLALERVAPAAPLTGRSAVRIVFDDDGPGFDHESLRRAFEPLYTTKREGGGSGLGMASIERLVRGAGGHVTLRNRSPRGARVQIDLPLAD